MVVHSAASRKVTKTVTSVTSASMGFHRALYEATGDPIYAWKCYLQWRRVGTIPPEWVLEYLDAAASAIVGVAGDFQQRAAALPKGNKGARRKLSDQSAGRLSAALGFNRRGRGNYLLQPGDFKDRKFWLAVRVMYVKRSLGTRGATKAIDVVAAEQNEPTSNVRDAWKKFQALRIGFSAPGDTVTITPLPHKMVRQAQEAKSPTVNAVVISAS